MTVEADLEVQVKINFVNVTGKTEKLWRFDGGFFATVSLY